MAKPRRNDRCPCGSGKKYKTCCSPTFVERRVQDAVASGKAKIVDYEAGDGQARILLEDNNAKPILVDIQSDDLRRTSGFGYPLDMPTAFLQQAGWDAYQLGQYEDAIELNRELNRREGMLAGHYECVHLASAGLGKTNSLLQTESSWKTDQDRIEKIETHYPVDGLWFALNRHELEVDESVLLVERCLERVSEDLWMVPAVHPTSALLVTDWILTNTDRTDLARQFVCCCLGWKYVYRRVDDLILLARLLEQLKAPKLFWTRIANLYYDFSTFDSVNQQLVKTQKPSVFDGLKLYVFWKTVDDKEGILHRFCADHGFPERDTVIDLLFDSFELKDEGYGKCNKFPGKSGYQEGDFKPWLGETLFQMRHPWFCLLQEKERAFIRNGDTGFLACVTDDYSMACSQWWRAIESVLRRKLIEPLGNLLDANPAWIAADLDHAGELATEREMAWEELFVRVLADPRRRSRMTLTQMLILIDKCISDHRKNKTSTSQVRANAVRHVAAHLSEFKWIKSEPDEFADMRSAYSPNVLTERSIQSFRNASSHDEPMEYAHAVAGRLLAIRILDFMHYPRYCVTKKLEELKAELRDSNETSKS